MSGRYVCFGTCERMYEVLAKRSFSTIEKLSDVTGYSYDHARKTLLKLEEAGCAVCVSRYRDGRSRNLWKVTGKRPIAPMVFGPPRARPTKEKRRAAVIEKKAPQKLDIHRLAKLNSIWSTE